MTAGAVRKARSALTVRTYGTSPIPVLKFAIRRADTRSMAGRAWIRTCKGSDLLRPQTLVPAAHRRSPDTAFTIYGRGDARLARVAALRRTLGVRIQGFRLAPGGGLVGRQWPTGPPGHKGAARRLRGLRPAASAPIALVGKLQRHRGDPLQPVCPMGSLGSSGSRGRCLLTPQCVSARLAGPSADRAPPPSPGGWRQLRPWGRC